MAHDAPRSRRTLRALRAAWVVAASVALHALVWLLVGTVDPRPPPPPGTTAISVSYSDRPPLPSPNLTDRPQPVRKPRPAVRRVEAPPEPTPEELDSTDEPADEPTDTTDGSLLLSDAPSDEGSPGEGFGGPPAPGPAPRDLKQLDLFDPSALGRVASIFGTPRPMLQDVGRGGNGDDPASEQARVSSRLGDEIGKMVALGNAQAGLVSDCFDGVDQGFDDAIDCAAEGCREHPLCFGTQVLDAAVDRDIPDDDLLGAASLVHADDRGPVRAVSVKVAFRHASPGDLAIVLEAPDGRRAVLRRADRSDPLYGRAFFARDLVGSPSGGRWRLRVMDVISGVTGHFEAWQLVVTAG